MKLIISYFIAGFITAVVLLGLFMFYISQTQQPPLSEQEVETPTPPTLPSREPCDLDSDGDCDRDDFEIFLKSIHMCSDIPPMTNSDLAYNPLADANGDKCVDEQDMELLFPEYYRESEEQASEESSTATSSAEIKESPPTIPKDQEKSPAPKMVKAVYLTGWSAGLESRVQYVIDLARTTDINAVVVDVKDFSGYITYDTDVPEVETYNAERIAISDIDGLLKRFHDEEIYVIARVTVFQDPILAVRRPDLAVHSNARLALLAPIASDPSAASLWTDRKGLAWIDPASQEAWEYIVAIAKDATSRGFDEINFDYIRFPSDGDLQDMKFLSWDSTASNKRDVIRSFFEYLRQQLPDAILSADLFGLATINYDDLGIGQVIEDAYEYFDYVSPMVYPSHYADGFLGYENPAEFPYEVVKYSLESADLRLEVFETALQLKSTVEKQEPRVARLRPWLQDFDLGAEYDAVMVRKEIQAVKDAMGERFSGYMLWNPSNIYTIEALREEQVQEVDSILETATSVSS